MGEELSKVLFFFPEFMKKDFFEQKNLKVIDVALGAYHTIVLCKDLNEKDKTRVFGIGSS